MAKLKTEKPAVTPKVDGDGWQDLGRKLPAFTRLDVGDVLIGKLANVRTGIQLDKKAKKGGREKFNLEIEVSAAGEYTRGKKKEAKRVEVPVGEVISFGVDGNLIYLLNDGLENVGSLPKASVSELKVSDFLAYKGKEFRIERVSDSEITKGPFKGKERKNYSLKMR